jgi:RNA polymerase sigma factor (sigma-70 family)
MRFTFKKKIRKPPGAVQPVPDPKDYVKLAYWTANQWLNAVNSRYPGLYEDRRDEVQGEAMLCLMRCVSLFDRHRGYQFSTYVGNSIYRWLQAWEHRKGGARDLDRLDPKDAATGRTRRVVESLDFAAADGWTPAMGVADRGQDPVDAWMTRDAVEHYLALLTPRERQVVAMRFFEGLTFRACGRKLGVSKERVRQIQVRALAKMREAAASEERASA